MIADRDIWRAANLLISEHGANAEIVAAIESVADVPMDLESARASASTTPCAIGSNVRQPPQSKDPLRI